MNITCCDCQKKVSQYTFHRTSVEPVCLRCYMRRNARFGIECPRCRKVVKATATSYNATGQVERMCFTCAKGEGGAS